jgi:predicted amidohydrolase
VFKKKKDNIERIRVSLQKYTDKDLIDILMLPEMAFIGYNFKNAEHILEETE